MFLLKTCFLAKHAAVIFVQHLNVLLISVCFIRDIFVSNSIYLLKLFSISLHTNFHSTEYVVILLSFNFKLMRIH